MGVASDIVFIIANIMSIVFFLSPARTFFRIHQNQAVGQFQPIPEYCAFLNCLFLTLYGLPSVCKDNILFSIINGVGIVIELIYIIIYGIYAPNIRRRVVSIVLSEIGIAAAVATYAIVLLEFKDRAIFVGDLCVFFNIIMYASLLVVMVKVIATNNRVQDMPFWLFVAGLANGICWTIYAIIQHDRNILIGNGLGAVLGVVELGIYACCYFQGMPPETEPLIQRETVGGDTAEGQSGTVGGDTAEGQSGTVGGDTEEGQSGTVGGDTAEGQSGTVGGDTAEGQSGTVGGDTEEGQSGTAGGETAEGQSGTVKSESAEAQNKTADSEIAEAQHEIESETAV